MQFFFLRRRQRPIKVQQVNVAASQARARF